MLQDVTFFRNSPLRHFLLTMHPFTSMAGCRSLGLPRFLGILLDFWSTRPDNGSFVCISSCLNDHLYRNEKMLAHCPFPDLHSCSRKTRNLFGSYPFGPVRRLAMDKCIALATKAATCFQVNARVLACVFQEFRAFHLGNQTVIATTWHSYHLHQHQVLKSF